VPGQAAQDEQSFGTQLRRLRLTAGLSQEDLAERAGLSPGTVAALEDDRRRRPYPNTLAALAHALDLPVEQRAAFMQGVSTRSPPPVTPGAPASTVPPPEPAVHYRSLPLHPTALFGRDHDVQAATTLLHPSRSNVRLLTLMGPGGVGKTRLALAIAHALREARAYADGIAFADLSSARDHRLVPAVLAESLNVHESPGRSARELVEEHVGDRQLLLVLDNLEHVLDAGPWLAAVLAHCPRVALLVTSRAALHVRAEQRYLVGPLATAPDDASLSTIAAAPAVQMFVDRAHAVMPDFHIDESVAPVVGAICRRLGGVPLAIELAAARVRLLDPETLLQRIELMLPVLLGGPKDAPERHRALRQTLDWSHALLGAAAKTLFRRLAVFKGGWTLDAAEAVCAGDQLAHEDILELASALLDNSLIARVTGRRGLQARFRMLDPVREYAEERLVEADEMADIRRRHLAWAVELIRPIRADPPDEGRVELLTAEADNLRAALRTAIDTAAVEHGLWLAVAMSLLWFVRGTYAEGRAWLNELLALPGRDGAPVARAHALTAAGHLACCQGDYVASEQHLASARALASEHNLKLVGGVAVHLQGNVARWRGDLDGALHCYESALATYRSEAHAMWEATALAHMAFVTCEQGDLARATACADRSLALFQAAHNTWGASRALRALARIAAQQREAAKALSLHQASQEFADQLADEHNRAFSIVAMADDLHSSGDTAQASQLYERGLAVAEKSGDRLLTARCVEGLATLSAERSPERAVRLAAGAHALRSSLGASGQLQERERLSAALASAQRALGAAGFVAAWNAGLHLEIPQLVVEAARCWEV
jgi:predicted ATPase/transcriptional regulator with XRE-family HTH domain